MLLPLVRILARARDARVVFLPSDHHVPDPAPIARAVLDAARGPVSDRLALVGVAPTAPEVEYGWIVSGARLPRTRAFTVDSFHEKPTPAIADELWRSGGLWNTFISTGPARVYWDLARRHLPDHTDALECYAATIGTAAEPAALRRAYDAMIPANFSRGVLAFARMLAVLPVTGTGWSDWGSPQRVFASLAGTATHDRLVERIRGDLAFAG
jgi:mannose-1-phosphate guanylyltransferase/mannose-6-phosphate isomerase